METVFKTSLPADPSAIKEARHSIDHLETSFPDGFLPAVQLAISELVTNSIRYGSEKDDCVELRICQRNESLRVEVYDSGPGFDAEESTQEPSRDLTHGRGLMIVQTLAASWGVFRTGERNCVWAEFNPQSALV